MSKLLPFILIVFIAATSYGQELPADSGSFLLHKFEQHIGKETYRVYNYKDSKKYLVDFKFTDRGQPVPLKAEIKVNPVGDPLELNIKGSTSRFSAINDSIKIKGNTAFLRIDDSIYQQKITPLTFPIAGYSPATSQQLLLQYWNRHKQPSTIKTLPFGELQIKKDGTDKLLFKGKQLVFDRYTIGGLIWGNELLWTDQAGRLICILTIDAEGDKTEMMREEFEPLLKELISRAAGYGMAAFAKAAPDTENPTQTLAIKGGQWVDVTTGKTIANDVILVKNGTIVAIGKNAIIPKNAKVINAAGKTIVPGLWDMHAHFEQTEWGPAYLAAGVTTVRDCGNEIGFIDGIQKSIDSGKGIGPKILMAGIIDGKGPMALGIIQADTKQEAISAVDTYKAKGFDQIKIYSSVKPEIVKVICDEAHRLGLKVTGHIPRGMNLKAAADSGMDMVNHLQYVTALMKTNPDRTINFNDSTTLSAIKFIKDKHIVVDPTLGVYTLSARNLKDDVTKMEPAFYTLPLPLQTQFKTTGVDEATAAKYKPVLKSYAVLVKKLYDEGVPIVAGTDMGFPGFSVIHELEIYVEGGLTTAEALKTATIIPAQVMSLDKQTGSIAVGKNADLVIIDGDPLTNISNLRNVKTVIKHGKIYDPVVLHQMVGFSK
ncbi:amidohydrolase family protein [Mucilaginibacter gynuensis]